MASSRNRRFSTNGERATLAEAMWYAAEFLEYDEACPTNNGWAALFRGPLLSAEFELFGKLDEGDRKELEIAKGGAIIEEEEDNGIVRMELFESESTLEERWRGLRPFDPYE